MEIRTVLVHYDIDADPDDLTAAAIALAREHRADLLGHTSAAPSPMLLTGDPGVASGLAFEQERQRIEAIAEKLQHSFLSSVAPGIEGEWFSDLEAPNRSLLSFVHRADLLLTATTSPQHSSLRALDVGHMALAAGRPILAIGSQPLAVKDGIVVVGWKNTRETRRAIADALPLLSKAREVVVVSVSKTDEPSDRVGVDSVVRWLDSHGIQSRGHIAEFSGDVGRDLANTMSELAADLLVTGAYGHSRLREWLFGGVTRHLLETPGLARFFSN